MRFLFAILMAASAFAQNVVDPYRFGPPDPCVSCAQNTSANNMGWASGNQWVYTNTVFSAVSDSKTVTISFWVKRNDLIDNRVIFQIYGPASAKLQVTIVSGKIKVTGQNGAPADILNIETASAYIGSTGVWYHVLIVVDMADTAKRKIYVDGVSRALTVTTFSNDTLDLLCSNPIKILFNDANSLAMPLNGYLSEFWFDDSYNDNICYFYCSGKPTQLGANGDLANGQLPACYLSSNGSGTAWRVDSSGNGNHFSVISSTPTSTTSP